jgi:hypothetical protein
MSSRPGAATRGRRRGAWSVQIRLRPPARAPTAPAVSCAALTGLSLPDLPGSDTATVSANEVAGSGCQVAIEITDT